jgi:hypothetical protein
MHGYICSNQRWKLIYENINDRQVRQLMSVLMQPSAVDSDDRQPPESALSALSGEYFLVAEQTKLYDEIFISNKT